MNSRQTEGGRISDKDIERRMDASGRDWHESYLALLIARTRSPAHPQPE